MEEVISIPPGLPRQNPTISYWQTPPDELADMRTTEALPGSVDIIIVGSGLSGSSIAYNLLSRQPDLQIVMLEARQAASGASGRNGGHTKHASYRKFASDIEKVGVQDAIKIANLEYRCMTSIHEFVKQNNINCDSNPSDTVDIYYDKEQFEYAYDLVKSMKRQIGSNSPVTHYEFFGPQETAAKFLTPNTFGSVKYKAGSLSAYRLTTGILKLALAKGLNLQCNTPALAIKKSELESNLWTVETPRGQVTAPRVILATNAHTAHLYPKLQGNIVPIRGIVTALRPGSHMPQRGLDTTYSFAFTQGYDYMVTRPAGSKNEGDIVIGSGRAHGPADGLGEIANTDDTTVDPEIEAYLRDNTPTFFGANWGDDNPDGRVRHIWSGVMAYSADGYPLIGQVPGEQGLWLHASFQGHGMVTCFLCADAVSDMVLGRDGEELNKWFPKCFRVTEERINKKFTGFEHSLEKDAGVEHGNGSV